MYQQGTQLQVILKGGKTRTWNNYIINQILKICYIEKGVNGLSTRDELKKNDKTCGDREFIRKTTA